MKAQNSTQSDFTGAHGKLVPSMHHSAHHPLLLIELCSHLALFEEAATDSQSCLSKCDLFLFGFETAPRCLPLTIFAACSYFSSRFSSAGALSTLEARSAGCLDRKPGSLQIQGAVIPTSEAGSGHLWRPHGFRCYH